MKDKRPLAAALLMRVDAGTGALYIGARRLPDTEVHRLLLARIADLEEDHYKLIGALQQIGLDYCESCEEWQQRQITIADHCYCLGCVTAHPDGLLAATDYTSETDLEGAREKIVRFITGCGNRPNFTGAWLATYRRIA